MFARFLRASFGPAEYRRLRATSRPQDAPGGGHVDHRYIREEMETVREATGRPTAPPSPSSPGDGDLDAPRARVVSLARGEVTFVDPPPRRAPEDHKGKGGTRRRASSAG